MKHPVVKNKRMKESSWEPLFLLATEGLLRVLVPFPSPVIFKLTGEKRGTKEGGRDVGEKKKRKEKGREGCEINEI